MTFVLDASVTLACVFEGEETPVTEAVLESLQQTEAIAPSVWPYEVGNALVVGARRGKLTPATASHFTEPLQNLPITPVEASTALLWGSVLSLAREQQLSVYDASYLELAIRKGVPLFARNI